MKIGIAIENFNPMAGGNERSTHEVARALIARGHDVTIIANTGRDEPDMFVDPDGPAADGGGPAGVGRTLFAGGPRTSTAVGLLRFVTWARRELDSGRYDVTLSTSSAVPAMILQPRNGTMIETLTRNLEIHPPGPGRWLKRMAGAINLKRRTLLWREGVTFTDPAVKTIVAISQYVADQLQHHYGLPDDLIQLIPNAAHVRPRAESERLALRTATRRALGLEDRHILFLFAAMNPRLKGYGPLIHALAQAARTQPDVRLLVAGPAGHFVKQLPLARSIADRVLCIGPTRRMDALYLACDGAILPSFYDSSNKVVLESLLNGRPVISTLFAGAAQWVYCPQGLHRIPSPFDPAASGLLKAASHQQAGRVIDHPNNVAALSAAIEELCDPAHRARCAQVALGADLAARISVRAHVDQLERLMFQLSGNISGG